MTLAELIASFRTDADDLVANPYLWTDVELTRWANEAEQEAALRAKLLFDAATTAVCQINIVAGTTSYPLHAKVHDVEHARTIDSGGKVTKLTITDRIELERVRPDWRYETRAPRALIRYDGRIEVDCIPDADYTLRMEVHRLPLVDLVANGDIPEIAPIHHRHLVKWMLHRAYERPDSETRDPDKSARAEKEFTKVFGRRPDADLRRAQQANRPHFNKAVW
jgi:hypothetical protein